MNHLYELYMAFNTHKDQSTRFGKCAGESRHSDEERSSDLALLPFGLIFVRLLFLLLGKQRLRLRSVREKHIASHVQDLRPTDREDGGRLIQFPTFSQITDYNTTSAERAVKENDAASRD